MMTQPQLISLISASIIYLLLVMLAFRITSKENEHDVHLNLSLLIFGATLGWLVGILISPYSEGEEKMFATYAGAISAFISGYFIAKFDGFFSKLTSTETLSSSFTPVISYRIMATLCIFIVTMIIVFVFRHYPITIPIKSSTKIEKIRDKHMQCLNDCYSSILK